MSKHLTSLFFLFLSIIFSGLAHADFPIEDGYGRLVSHEKYSRAVPVADIQTRFEGSELSRCIRYENDNDYDGDCLEWHSYCRLYVRFPGTDALGNPEEYRVDPSFFDSSLSANSYNIDCDGLLKKWSQNNSGKVIEYSVNGNIYEDIRWVWSMPNEVPKTKECDRVSIIRDEVVSGGHLLFRTHSFSQNKMNASYCEKL